MVTGGCDGFEILPEVWLYLINQKQWIRAECKGSHPTAVINQQSIIIEAIQALMCDCWEGTLGGLH